MKRFAESTSVPVERSQSELQRLLVQRGASKVGTINDVDHGRFAVAFELNGRRIRFEMTVPTAREFAAAANEDPPHGWKSWTPKKREEWAIKRAEQVERSRWRALVLVAKAKFELIAEGMSTVEREFLADLLLPNGQRVEQWMGPQLNTIARGKMPPLLPGAR